MIGIAHSVKQPPTLVGARSVEDSVRSRPNWELILPVWVEMAESGRRRQRVRRGGALLLLKRGEMLLRVTALLWGVCGEKGDTQRLGRKEKGKHMVFCFGRE